MFIIFNSGTSGNGVNTGENKDIISIYVSSKIPEIVKYPSGTISTGRIKISNMYLSKKIQTMANKNVNNKSINILKNVGIFRPRIYLVSRSEI